MMSNGSNYPNHHANEIYLIQISNEPSLIENRSEDDRSMKSRIEYGLMEGSDKHDAVKLTLKRQFIEDTDNDSDRSDDIQQRITKGQKLVSCYKEENDTSNIHLLDLYV